MKTLTPIIVFCIIVGAARGEEDPGFGKLNKVHSVSSRSILLPLSVPPQSPEKIGTQYYLMTRENLEHPQVISAMNLTAFNASSFRMSRKTVLIVHGLSDRAHDNWVSDMSREILLKEDANCIGVDWQNGSGDVLTYVQAISNGRVVSTQICEMLKMFLAKNYPLSKVHIIGHSLGAHIAGDAGRQCPGIYRVTGLDPAGPLFKNVDTKFRLDPSDALNVDVIYTDTEAILGFGIPLVVGHLNFYPNGGKHMEGCPNKVLSLLNVKDLFESLSCDHLRAYLYYTDTIRNPGGYISYPCDSYENFKSGACFPCPSQGCPTMGYYTEKWFNTSDQQLKFYLKTGVDPPYFSSWRYKVSLTFSGKESTFVYVSLYASRDNVTKYPIGSNLILTEENTSQFVDSPVKLHPLPYVIFKCWSFGPPATKVGAVKIDIQAGEDGTISSFCSNGPVLDGIELVLGPCTQLFV